MCLKMITLLTLVRQSSHTLKKCCRFIISTLRPAAAKAGGGGVSRCLSQTFDARSARSGIFRELVWPTALTLQATRSNEVRVDSDINNLLLGVRGAPFPLWYWMVASYGMWPPAQVTDSVT